MLDLGATSDCKAEYLNQFSSLASKYAELLLGIEKPRVGLLNIGEEVGKGNELTREAYTLLQQIKAFTLSEILRQLKCWKEEWMLLSQTDLPEIWY